MSDERMKVFDCHVHYSMEPRLEESVASFRRLFEETGVERVAFMSLPHAASEHFDVVLQNLKGLYLKHVFSPNAYCFAGLMHDVSMDDDAMARDFLRQVEGYAAGGFDGLKLLEGKPNLRKLYGKRLSDKVYEGVFAFMEEAGLPVTLHNADPAIFWDITKMSPHAIARGWYNDETADTKDEMLEDVMTVMRRHPRLKLTMAHFGFLADNIEQAKAFLDGFENTRVDLTPGGEQFFYMLEDREAWIPFLESHADKIKYGSDSYNYPTADDAAWRKAALYRPTLLRNFFETADEHIYDKKPYRGIDFDRALLRKIYTENAEREYGAPRDINVAWVKEKIESLRPLCQNDERLSAELAVLEKYFER